ncbi:hypothetical protein F9L16_02695 [Agarivorans sp. B2Z047]|uniref:hypothetical protein n=1 Tax=Agarivorans sp. B2Z047 TaxID=2652721 RepID=UPI00128E16AD|nr:hypothetical protein [Agarivorans sp. B2Z047]MPW27903.1 hypothetical protein [Agarivorans sp. B2Z047]UQN44262.1 hypothetical protein LQZ07_07265 [Agarivorans sp. B2Z047]
MKNVLIAGGLLAIGAGAGGYWYSQQATNLNSEAGALAYIPADTAVFSAQLKQFPIKAYVDSMAGSYNNLPSDAFAETDVSDPRGKFFIALFESYNEALKDGQTFVDTFGLANDIHSYFYTLGIVPVLKVEVSKADAIWAWLDKAEQKSGFSHTKQTLSGVEYRAYRLSDDSDSETADLIVTVNNGLLTITLNTSLNENSLLETALGLKPAEQPINTTTLIQDSLTKHGFMEEGIGFINHQEIAKAITTKDGNLLAKHLTKLAQMDNSNELTSLRTPVCEQEFASITANWPKTVMGFDSLSINDKESSFGVRMVVESNNSVLLSAYQAMSGFIPSYASNTENAVFSMAYGIDVNQLVPSLLSVWEEMLTPDYQCEPLQNVQMAMQQQNPGMVGMMTGMANGLKGIGMAVFDYKLADISRPEELESLDAIISVSADNPGALFDIAKQFSPELASVSLPADGTPVDVSHLLPLPPTTNIQPQLALKGNHLVLFNGQRAAEVSQQLAAEPVANNGLLSMFIDYQQMFEPIISGIELSGEEVPQELMDLKDYRIKVQMNMAVNDQGISFGSSMTSQADNAVN